MDRSLLLRNRSVSRIVVGVPEGHQHIRARIESGSGDVITLQEATLAALARAYLGIKTHPHCRAIELNSVEVAGAKEGFAEHQLLEVDTNEGALRRELAGGPGTTASQEEVDDPFVDAQDPTVPHYHSDLAGHEPATQPLPSLDITSGELSPNTAADDGPVFGDVPTVASKKQVESKDPSASDS